MVIGNTSIMFSDQTKLNHMNPLLHVCKSKQYIQYNIRKVHFRR